MAIAVAPEAQAVATTRLGPRAPNSIATCPAGMLGRYIASSSGFSASSTWCCSSKVWVPPPGLGGAPSATARTHPDRPRAKASWRAARKVEPGARSSSPAVSTSRLCTSVNRAPAPFTYSRAGLVFPIPAWPLSVTTLARASSSSISASSRRRPTKASVRLRRVPAVSTVRPGRGRPTRPGPCDDGTPAVCTHPSSIASAALWKSEQPPYVRRIPGIRRRSSWCNPSQAPPPAVIYAHCATEPPCTRIPALTKRRKTFRMTS